MTIGSLSDTSRLEGFDRVGSGSRFVTGVGVNVGDGVLSATGLIAISGTEDID